MGKLWTIAFLVAGLGEAIAGSADVVSAEAVKNGDTWTFNVTVKHGDTGWDHYADSWEVLDPNGEVLAVRVLLHPHVNEQPFTRSLGGVIIPGDIKTVTVRARDSVHGYGGAEIQVELPE